MASNFPAYIAQGWEKGVVVRDYVIGTASVVGSLIVYDISGDNMDLCGANPALIAGMSMINTANTLHLADPTIAPFAIVTDPSVIWAMGSATTPAITHIGDVGEIDNNGGNWRYDPATTTAARFRCVDIDITEGIFYLVGLQANLQFAGI